ncbi:hypothetical protein ACQKND_22490 [Viridibacillus arvi]|uniref:hypothetical protein n=1 Tax=Viridibacillus arvi TaxID=263475 RepID=UPI003D077659
MIYYKTVCTCCRETFKIIEGTKKYEFYKRNMKGKFVCETCGNKIYLEARKSLISKL